MAQLTPQDILDISEPIEAIYQRTVDELLINIARHFEISGWERTRYWEIKKLSEMGALTKESAAIIAKNTKMLTAEIEKAFLQVSEKACLDIDPQLRAAAAKGLLQDPMNTPSTSILMRQQIQSYVDQAVDKMNMTNTTMLESTRQVYFSGVQTAVNAATRAELKLAVETGALEVVTGVETRTMAIRKAMNAITDIGITGFYDKAGRKWSAEAYTAMVVRTTAHNAAITAVKTRQQEFGGGDIFQVSSHPAARPLCYPYQGKFFSWSSEGEFTDGAGHTHVYNNITDSSYGEPAGLFGINCGHHPIPMIPNFSYPQDGPEMTEAENTKAYEESQKQRQYERNIREAKRDVEIAKATGDTEAIKAAEQKVAREQANMRAYLKETGRPRRYDREKIAGTKDIDGYRGFVADRNSDIPLNGKGKVAAPYVEPNLDRVGLTDDVRAQAFEYGQRMGDKDMRRFNQIFKDAEFIEGEETSFDPDTKVISISKGARGTSAYHEGTHWWDYNQSYEITEDYGHYKWLVDGDGNLTGKKEWVPDPVTVRKDASFSQYVAYQWGRYPMSGEPPLMSKDVQNFVKKVGTSDTYGKDKKPEDVLGDLKAIDKYLKSKGVRKADPDYEHLSDFISALSYDANLGSLMTGGHEYDYWVAGDEFRIAEMTAAYNLLNITGRQDLIEIMSDLAPNATRLIKSEWGKIW